MFIETLCTLEIFDTWGRTIYYITLFYKHANPLGLKNES